jgi:hypothetical protein
MSSYRQLFARLVNKPSAEDLNDDQLKKIIEQYPYFSPARFALVKSLDQNSEEYKHYIQKAVLYYQNPHEFDFFIHNDNDDFLKTNENIIGKSKTQENNEEVVETPLGNANKTIQGLHPTPTELPVDESLTKMTTIEKDLSTELTFEPFHTVDYFASQGIKLSQQEATDDKMGKQLKSFTEWIRSMKRLPATELAKNVNHETDKKVENLAVASVEETNVVTEAMAEVWEKQGNNEKAIEVYNKLSLIYPAKSAYFAAKIEQLKENLS